MKGRKPKPTAIKDLQGNPGKRAKNHAEPVFSPSEGACPPWLSARAREEWGIVSAELKTLGMLQRVDAASLASYCQSVANVEAAQAEIDEHGLVIEDAMGKRIKNPAFNIQKEAMLLIQKFASEYGFTPAARARIKAPTVQKETDPLAEYLPAGDGVIGKIGA